MVSALAARAGSRVVCASSSSSKHYRHQKQQKQRETTPTTRTPSSIQQRLVAATLAATTTVLLLASSTPTSFSSPALAAEELAQAPDAPAAALFSKNCAGCHAGGGNVVSPGNTLFQNDLDRNGLVTPEKVFEVIYSGKGKMPGYGVNCAPKGACTFAARLSDEEVRALGDFVLERAAQGWK